MGAPIPRISNGLQFPRQQGELLPTRSPPKFPPASFLRGRSRRRHQQTTLYMNSACHPKKLATKPRHRDMPSMACLVQKNTSRMAAEHQNIGRLRRPQRHPRRMRRNAPKGSLKDQLRLQRAAIRKQEALGLRKQVAERSKKIHGKEGQMWTPPWAQSRKKSL